MKYWIWHIRYKLVGFKQWCKPSEFYSLRDWLLCVWNEYDDWLYNGIHGFRILGFEFETTPRWLDKLCWKLLPLIRFVNRRKEWTR